MTRPPTLARTVGEALDVLTRRPFRMVLSTLRECETVRLYQEVAERYPHLVRLAIADRQDAWLGSALADNTLHDVILRPWTTAHLRSAIQRAHALASTRHALLLDEGEARGRDERIPSRSDDVPCWLIGADAGLRSTVELARTVARSDATALVRGETGTGKELIARLIHESSPRRAGPFIRLNCAAIADGVLESELFGHEAGSFTGAIRQRAGRFEQASGGTLLLDEIADMSPKMQVRLLRVLQEQEIERVGGSTPVPVDVRIIAATHRPLEVLVAEGAFREDLFYRLNVVPIFLPPLRDRRQDIPVLVRAFVERHRRDDVSVQLDDAAMQMLVEHSWPGNVRELENIVHRCVVLASNGRIRVEHLAHLVHPPQSPRSRPPIRERARAHETNRLEQALFDAAGNCSRAARALGIPRTTLVSRAKRLGLI